MIPISRWTFEKDAEVSNLLLNFQNICWRFKKAADHLNKPRENQNFSRSFGFLAENSKVQLKIWNFTHEQKSSATFTDFQRIFWISGWRFGFPATGPKCRRQFPESPGKAGFSGELLTGGRQRRKSCRSSIFPAILLCSQRRKSKSRYQFSNACTAFVSQLANRLCRRIPGFPAKDSAGGRWNLRSGR